ncbi:hypothetical protein [Nitrosomonas sp.]|uniref:hypothetical protein n=1 Tax=Nitrosomonas sp. TaxID=42353 RepID=UPI00374CD534
MNRKKLIWNSESIDWAYWANLQLISFKDACWLVCGVDPNICNNESIESKYYLSDEKKIEINKAITQVKSDILAKEEKEYNSPWDWVCWAEGKGIPVPTKFHALAFEAKKKSIHVHTAQQLEEISEESLVWYMKQDSWAYYEAIFLIHGYKPPGSFEGFDEVRTHFPNDYAMLERSIPIGSIGKEVIQAGQKDFIDTPERWLEWGKSKGLLCEFLTRFEANNKNHNSLETEAPSAEVGDVPVSKQSKTQDDPWKGIALLKADEIYKKQKAISCDPSKSAIANLIAKEFEKDGIQTVKGKRLNGEYIKRHALNTWNRPNK